MGGGACAEADPLTGATRGVRAEADTRYALCDALRRKGVTVRGRTESRR
jgi:hypothetical protein